MRRPAFLFLVRPAIAGAVTLSVNSLVATSSDAGLISTTSSTTLYQEVTTVDSADDVVFRDAIWWTSMKPVVRVGRFTDPSGRRLVVTSIHAAPICGISGCPVRIRTETGETLLDQVSACDLTEDHHVSKDGRSFIACDERFAIPDRATIRRNTAEPSSWPAPIQHLYSLNRTIPDRFDPEFRKFWNDLADDIIWDPKARFHHAISVGQFVDFGGRGLTATTVYTMALCGMQVCPVRLYTSAGERLAKFHGCNATEFHRISSDRRHFIACGQAFRIPIAPERTAEASLSGADANALPNGLSKRIVYDSGSDISSPSDQIFRDYWSDRSSDINWKAPPSRRAHIFNASLPSADGRNFYQTLLLPGSRTDCGDQCRLRVLTAKRTVIMDIRVCSDIQRHEVSADQKFLIACGKSFAIPQVDEKVAIMENASLDSDPQVYLDVVLRDRTKSGPATQPIRVDTADHNRSEMLISDWKDGSVEIAYNRPRSGLPVAQGTVLFRGTRAGDRYSGTAYTFKAGCQPSPYAVTGTRNRRQESIVLSGAAPRRDPNSCETIGLATQSGHAKLVFDTRFFGDQ